MKTREEVLALFRAKYNYLKSVYPNSVSFEEAASSNFYQNPDGGWQMNLDNFAAITLRPGDDEAHETHGAICTRWYEEGGTFNKDGNPGWLGYPTKDEMPSAQGVIPPCPVFLREWNPSPIFVPGAVSEFDYGTIRWHEGLPWERANENHSYNGVGVSYAYQAAEDDYAAGREMEEALASLDSAVKARESGSEPNPKELCLSQRDLAVDPGTVIELNERGRNHVPQDIDMAIKCIILRRNFRPDTTETTACLSWDCKGPVWISHMTAKDNGSLAIRLWHDSSHAICGNMDETSAPPQSFIAGLLHNSTSTHKELFIPSYLMRTNDMELISQKIKI